MLKSTAPLIAKTFSHGRFQRLSSLQVRQARQVLAAAQHSRAVRSLKPQRDPRLTPNVTLIVSLDLRKTKSGRHLTVNTYLKLRAEGLT